MNINGSIDIDKIDTSIFSSLPMQKMLVSMEDLLSNNNDKDESLYWMKYLNYRLAVINVCLVLVPSELLLSTHLMISEGWTAEFTDGFRLVVLTMGFEPMRVDHTRFKTLGLNHSATPPMTAERDILSKHS